MKHLLTFTKTPWVAILVAAIGLGNYGCSDSVSISAQTVEVPLSSLTITPGTLQPSFSSNTTSYAVDAPTGATTVTLVATPKSSTTLVTIDGAIGTQRSISLGPPGSIKIIPIVLESQNGLTSTYTVTVTRLLSNDNNLSALSVKANNAAQPLVPDFDANTLDYKVDVQTNVASVTITATKSDPNAAMLIGPTTVPAGTNPGQALITLGSPGTTTPVAIEVTALNGIKKTYNLSIKRLSGDNNLSALNVSLGALIPAFAAGTTLYTIAVGTNVTSVNVSATKSDPNAVMAIESVTVPAGTASGSAPNLPLGAPGSDTPVSIIVTAQNGVDSKTYTVTVHRAASDDSNLSTLVVTANAVAHPIDLNAPPPYTINVPTNVTSVDVSATKSDPNAVMAIGSVTIPAGTASGSALNLPLGGPGSDTLISVLVTAQNGVDSKTYTITVHRTASDDSNLLALSLTAATVPVNLTPAFDQNHFDYTVEVPFGIFEVTVTATKSDPNAVLSGSVPDPGIGIATGQATISYIFLPPPQISIIVTAQNTTTFKTYTITVNQSPPLFP
ncbi:MAG: cadherin-like beta sandwich domain-containing protein [Nitrospira sp.]|nr:cadherin-like beta sandwich domain-containing protein [Nitrospira sp.]